MSNKPHLHTKTEDDHGKSIEDDPNQELESTAQDAVNSEHDPRMRGGGAAAYETELEGTTPIQQRDFQHNVGQYNARGKPPLMKK